jgi:transcription elongation GreA/GreB family factor
MKNETEKKFYLTEKGKQEKEEELKKLLKEKNKLIKIIENEIKQGDLSENTGYEYANKEKIELEKKIMDLKYILNKVEIIRDNENAIENENNNEDFINNKKEEKVVIFGSKITFKVINKNNKIAEVVKKIKIASPFEINHELGIISYETDFAKSIMGKKINDEIMINTVKPYKIKILEIN